MDKAKTKYLSPELAVRIAWGLTHQLSGTAEVREEASRMRTLMEDIKDKAKKDKDEERYVDSAFAAVTTTFRGLVTIVSGRNINFDEVNKLRNRQIENIQYISRFSSDLQSLVLRLSGMTVGGVSVSVILTKFVEPLFPRDLRAYALPLLLAIGAAIG